jgi:hypothetical protein
MNNSPHLLSILFMRHHEMIALLTSLNFLHPPFFYTFTLLNYMNLASAYISNIKTLVSIQPTSALLIERQPHDHSSCLSVIEADAYGYRKITARGEQQTPQAKLV